MNHFLVALLMAQIILRSSYLVDQYSDFMNGISICTFWAFLIYWLYFWGKGKFSYHSAVYFTVIVFIISFTSINSGDAIGALIGILYFAQIFLLYKIFSNMEIKKTFRSLRTLSIVIILINMTLYLLGIDSAWLSGRFRGISTSVMELDVMLVCIQSIINVSGKYIDASRHWRTYVYNVIILFLLLQSESRGYLIIGCAQLLYMIWVNNNALRKTTLILIISLLALASITLLPNFNDDFDKWVNPEGRSFDESRMRLWEMGYFRFTNSFWLGEGWSEKYFSGTSMGTGVVDYVWYRDPHNTFLTILLSGGLIGFILWSISIIYFWSHGKLSNINTDIVFSGLLVCAAMFQDSSFFSLGSIWAILYLISPFWSSIAEESEIRNLNVGDDVDKNQRGVIAL
jgi:hypothetical protein